MHRIENASYLGVYNNNELKEFKTEHLVAELHRRGLSLKDLGDRFTTLDFVMDGASGKRDEATQEAIDQIERFA